MISCKSIFEKAEDTDGIRILVARFIPKKMPETNCSTWDIHIPDVGPSPELLGEFKKQRIKFPIFIKKYLDEMKKKPAEFALRSITSLSLTNRITLVCFEKTETFCHRRLVKDLVENLTIKCGADYERIWTCNVFECAIKMMEDRFLSKIRDTENKIASDKVVSETTIAQ